MRTALYNYFTILKPRHPPLLLYAPLPPPLPSLKPRTRILIYIILGINAYSSTTLKLHLPLPGSLFPAGIASLTLCPPNFDHIFSIISYRPPTRIHAITPLNLNLARSVVVVIICLPTTLFILLVITLVNCYLA
jgi:hypothetical protein